MTQILLRSVAIVLLLLDAFMSVSIIFLAQVGRQFSGGSAFAVFLLALTGKFPGLLGLVSFFTWRHSARWTGVIWTVCGVAHILFGVLSVLRTQGLRQYDHQGIAVFAAIDTGTGAIFLLMSLIAFLKPELLRLGACAAPK